MVNKLRGYDTDNTHYNNNLIIELNYFDVSLLPICVFP